MKATKPNKMGFTLLELLIVILIIGLLSAISIPMYKKAVEKSKVSDALSTMQAVSKSEHGWYLVKNNYTKDFANLDIDLYDKDGNKAENESFDSINYTFTLQDNAIKAERNNNEYTLYKLYEDGNIYCLPQDHYICEQYGWGVNKELCNSINGAWSNIKSACYNSEQERCADSDNGATWMTSTLAGGYVCGFSSDSIYTNEFQVCVGTKLCNYSTFTGGDSICYSNYGGCSNSQFNQGSVCKPYAGGCDNNTYAMSSSCYGGSSSCKYSTFTTGSKCFAEYASGCKGSTFSDGAECVTSPIYTTGLAAGDGGCHAAIFKEGGKCIANGDKSCTPSGSVNVESIFEPGSYCVGNAENSCKGFRNFQATCVANAPGACAGNTYTGNGCCSGDYCPADAPKCS